MTVLDGIIAIEMYFGFFKLPVLATSIQCYFFRIGKNLKDPRYFFPSFPFKNFNDLFVLKSVTAETCSICPLYVISRSKYKWLICVVFRSFNFEHSSRIQNSLCIFVANHRMHNNAWSYKRSDSNETEGWIVWT